MLSAVCPDHLHVVPRKDAAIEAGHRGVEPRLPAEGRQHRVDRLAVLFLPDDDLLDRLRCDRLDIGRVGEAGIGHDRCRVGVDQHHPVPLRLQRLARLGAGIVELAGLADDDRAGADDEDGLDVGAFWHRVV